jgi:hypothetical protein
MDRDKAGQTPASGVQLELDQVVFFDATDRNAAISN